MKPAKKREVLTHISLTLAAFNAAYVEIFLCPACLKPFRSEEYGRVSLAHILPRAAGGGLTTWLCRECNSQFGHDRDKWLGEYLNFMRSRSLLDSKISKGKLAIDGVAFGGDVRQTESGIDVFISMNRNSPSLLKQISDQFSMRKSKMTISIGVPLLSKSAELNRGFVTAAYLYGFALFGYSWVLQKHYEPIRDYITGRAELQSSGVHISKITKQPKPVSVWFGFVSAEDQYLPCVGIFDRAVFFPPFYFPDAVKTVSDPNAKFTADVKIMEGIPPYNYAGPFCLTIGSKPIIYPDAGLVDRSVEFIVHIDPQDFKANILTGDIQSHLSTRDDGSRILKFIIAPGDRTG